MRGFLDNFTFTNFNLTRRPYTMLTCHFSHMSFLSYAIDSVIMYLFCMQLQYQFGPLYIAKLLILGVAIGNILLCLKHSGYRTERPFLGNDALLRSLIFTVIFQNPTASFYLIPFPF